MARRLAERIKALRPPNLRRGNAKRRCALCVHYGDHECLKFGWRVRPTEICDAFEAKEGGRGGR